MILTYGKIISERIEQLYKIRNMNTADLSRSSGLTQSTINSILNGKSANPKMSIITLIAKGFDMTVTAFLDFPLLNRLNKDQALELKNNGKIEINE